jgi:hypothetical protein
MSIVLKPLNKQTSYYLLACCVSLFAMSQLNYSMIFSEEEPAVLVNLNNVSNETSETALNNNTNLTQLLSDLKKDSLKLNSALKTSDVFKTDRTQRLKYRTDTQPNLRESDRIKEVNEPVEYRFNSKHEILGIRLSSIIVVNGLTARNNKDSILRSEIQVDIPKLAINFTIFNNYTFDQVQSNRSALSLK